MANFHLQSKTKKGRQPLLIFSFIFICANLWSCSQGSETNKEAQSSAINTEEDSTIFKFKMPPFGNSDEDKLAEYGQKLVDETYNYFYSDGRKTGNQLSCKSCHLDGGTKPYGIPFIGLTRVFPTYIGRENRLVTLEERINGCFERSMNGKAIPPGSREMKAIVAYIGFLSRGVTKKGRLKGQGTLPLDAPNRRADTIRGKMVYQNECQRCHQPDGQGIELPDKHGYIYPPLWGPRSFNDGAGMGRELTAARFIKGNMPFGVIYTAPQLTNDDAYDVAAYINSFSRPVKEDKQRDYPDLTKKPKDCPYPPYADTIPQIQHKYGPFNF